MADEQFFQGDILFLRVSDKAKNIKPQHGKKAIIARGEKTGHTHEIALDTAQYWPSSDGVSRLVVVAPTPVVHQEHGPLELPEGEYEVHQQRQYTPERPVSMAMYE